MRIGKTGDRQLTLIRALLHGDSGIGKTTSLGTLPEQGTLLIAVERGLLPLRAKNYTVISIDEWGDLREIVRAIQSGVQAEDGSVTVTLARETIPGIKALAIDSLTECNSLCKRQIVDIDRRAVTRERTQGKREVVAGLYDDQMTKEDWGLLGTRMASFISAVNHLPVHTIFTSLSTWKEEQSTGKLMRIPALNGALAVECAAYFDLVLHMENTKNEEGADARVWRTMNDGNIIAKDASGVLDPFEPPHWGRIIAKILKGDK